MAITNATNTVINSEVAPRANRATLAKAQAPEWKPWFDRYSWTHIFWVPMATWVWLWVLIASLRDKRRGYAEMAAALKKTGAEE